MDIITRLMHAAPVIHPATVGRLVRLPNELPSELSVTNSRRMQDICRYMADSWSKIHRRPFCTNDVLALCRKRVPMDWIAIILNIESIQLPSLWDEIDSWVARGIIQPLPRSLDDPGPTEALMLQHRLFKT
jgi:hypothetical protein